MKKREIDDIQINDPLLKETLKGNPFLVPKDYFSTLRDETILKKNISTLGETSFIVPQDYQKNLTQDILSKISEEKIKEFLPASESALPPAYFNDLQKRILSKTVGASEDDVVVDKGTKEIAEQETNKPVRRLGIPRWASYAAAASIAVLISLFVILDGDKLTTGQNINPSAHISSVPTDEIISYLSYYSEAGDLLYLSDQFDDLSVDLTEDFSSQDIEAYLEYGI
ncbi:MAG TPA: hypothetical protein VKZ95_07735 [Sphingobacteriaceae bacterium]|nr:hypothetical protein [Sphingobacteriaceae bacterium]